MIGLGSSEFDLHSELDRLTANASENGVVLYPVSASGRDSNLISAAVGGSPDGASGGMMRNAQIIESQQRDASLLQMADDTGGVAFTGNANLGALLDRVQEDFTYFYSLGYTNPSLKRGNDLQKIKVKIKREGLVARHLKGFRNKTWRDQLGEMTAAAALLGIESNPHAIQLAALQPVRRGKHYQLSVVVQIPLPRIQMLESGGRHSAKLTLLAMVQDRKGDFTNPVRVDLPIEIPAEQIAQNPNQAVGYPLELEAKASPQRVAIGLYDHIGKRASCLKLDLATDADDEKGGKRRKKD
jgi:hypothetical protein